MIKNIDLSNEAVKALSIQAIEHGTNFKNYVESKLEKISKIFLIKVCSYQKKTYICTQITTTKFLSLKKRNYDNINILHLEHKN
jgi:hypothetical protein